MKSSKPKLQSIGIAICLLSCVTTLWLNEKNSASFFLAILAAAGSLLYFMGSASSSSDTQPKRHVMMPITAGAVSDAVQALDAWFELEPTNQSSANWMLASELSNLLKMSAPAALECNAISGKDTQSMQACATRIHALKLSELSPARNAFLRSPSAIGAILLMCEAMHMHLKHQTQASRQSA